MAVASDPLDGLEQAPQFRPNLVLIDINMPTMSGWQVAARLKALAPSAVLVAFSADLTPEARQRALAAGCDGYMTKPLDVDTFPDEVAEFLHGKRETLPDLEKARQEFLQETVATLELRLRELTRSLHLNAELNSQNQQLIAWLRRRQRLLEAASRVSHVISSILDLDELLRVTVDAIVDQYQFYFASIYLCEPGSESVTLRAGSGSAGTALLAQKFTFLLSDENNIAAVIHTRQPQLALLDRSPLPVELSALLPDSISRLALPLVVNDVVLGALSVHSSQQDGFSEDDMTALQSLANQVAIAIKNARTLQDLDNANRQLLRTKTFEAIAAATGETIHWVGNKAAPIPSSAKRVREDVAGLLAACLELQNLSPEQRAGHPLAALVQRILPQAQSASLDLAAEAQRLAAFSPRQLERLGGLESILEDLMIIEQSATAILAVKEDFLGPVRLQKLVELSLPELINQVIFQMNLPADVVQTEFASGLPKVRADASQLGQVYNNLIKNAWEALHRVSEPLIIVRAFMDDDPYFIRTEICDNGPGIPPEIVDKIWVSFFTTKGDHGGTGLGLSACMKIINQLGGRITVETEVGQGATFIVLIPVPE